MPAECSVALLRIAIEPDVLAEKVLKCLQNRVVPMLSRQHCAKHSFQPTVFVAGKSHCPAVIVHRPDPSQISLTDSREATLPILRNCRKLERPSHKLVMVHPLPGFGNAGPRRKVIGVPLAAIELQQSLIVRIEAPCDFQILAKLN